MKISKFTKDAMSKDTVLNIEDIKRVGIKLGYRVTLLKVEKAQHDIFLSLKVGREFAFDKMFSWLSKIDFNKLINKNQFLIANKFNVKINFYVV
jgi:hypothetical protein